MIAMLHPIHSPGENRGKNLPGTVKRFARNRLASTARNLEANFAVIFFTVEVDKNQKLRV
jgi:hypothetical protein